MSFIELRTNILYGFGTRWVWHPTLSRSFENFRRVLHDFRKVFGQHIDRDTASEKYVRTEKFYKIREWNPELYSRLSDEYQQHVGLLEDLTLELTRAGNRTCELVREHVSKNYRMKEGLLIARTGTWSDGMDHMLRVAYSETEKQLDYAYPGLADFMTVRGQRDFHFSDAE